MVGLVVSITRIPRYFFLSVYIIPLFYAGDSLESLRAIEVLVRFKASYKHLNPLEDGTCKFSSFFLNFIFSSHMC